MSSKDGEKTSGGSERMQRQNLVLRTGVLQQITGLIEGICGNVSRKSRIADAECISRKLSQQAANVERVEVTPPVPEAPNQPPLRTLKEINVVRAKITHTRLEALKGYIENSPDSN